MTVLDWVALHDIGRSRNSKKSPEDNSKRGKPSRLHLVLTSQICFVRNYLAWMDTYMPLHNITPSLSLSRPPFQQIAVSFKDGGIGEMIMLDSQD